MYTCEMVLLLSQLAEGDEEDIEDVEDEESGDVLDDETDEYEGASPEAGSTAAMVPGNAIQEVLVAR